MTPAAFPHLREHGSLESRRQGVTGPVEDFVLDRPAHPERRVAALAHARSTAEAAGAVVAGRVDWVEADLATWAPQPGHFDLVVYQYVHLAGSVQEMARRMGAGVAPGGALLLVGHRPIDPATGTATPAAGQQQVSVQAAVAALDPRQWKVVVAEGRPRAAAGTGIDAVIRAWRLS
jgi:hypothetical protein